MDLLDPGVLIVGGSFAGFRVLNRELHRLIPAPSSALRNPWKWRNIWTSFIHSLLTGSWALLSFYLLPEMAEDLISTTPSRFSHSLVAVSIGSDLKYHNVIHISQSAWLKCAVKIIYTERLFEDTFSVITCFGISLLLHRYVGFSVVALLVEINSIFLHMRQILLMANLVKTITYRLNSLLNLGTYMIFRITTLAWMTRWLVLNRENIPLLTYTIGSVGLAIMTVMNIVLFYRLLRSDFLKSTRDQQKEKEK
ncbi:TLC domain-containing protein 2 [Bombina bombina]|uniref:TLC domain-containing protein 2 n=1 Tax=Bombina bombina TaxID=8345 RepID=UPI00235A8982|nr:TLC domain-containing protein 2 [Bombina bombina]